MCILFLYIPWGNQTKWISISLAEVPVRLLLPFAALWSSISWLGELRLWYLTGQQITAPLKALWKWPISHLCVCWGGGCSRKKNPIVIVHIHWNWGLFFASRLLRHIWKWWKWDFKLQRIFLLRDGRYVSLGLFPCFFLFSPTGRNINKNPTFSALVIPVIKTCWQLKVKFIVTLGPRVCCHIKNWLRMQSWPSNRHKRRGEIKGLPSEDLTTTLVPLSLGMCVYGNVCCAS